MTTLRHNGKSNQFQCTLRDAIYWLIGERHGQDIHEIHAAVLEMEAFRDCSDGQLRTAMEWLRANDYVMNDGGPHPKYFQAGDGFVRNSVPAIGAEKLRCHAIPAEKLSPTAWTLHMLGLSISVPVTNLRRSRQEHHAAKLSDQDVEEMRAKYVPHVYGYARIAKEFGCPESTARDICKQVTRNVVK